MNQALFGVAIVLALAASTAAEASGTWTGRAGLTGGNFKDKFSFTDQGCCGSPGTTLASGDESSGIYGVLLGTGLGFGRFFGDLGIEYSQFAKKQDLDLDGNRDDTEYRSDGLLTLGMYLGDRWVAFLGYRHSTFGTGFFSDTKGDSQDGPFLGGGVSFRPGEKLSLGTSVAYNLLTLKVNGQALDNVDLHGVSLKLQLSFLGTPHSVFLRWQRFKGDLNDAANGVGYEQTDDYLNLGYQATFDFKTW